ncbi:lytic murein transglycosylase [Nocardia sp. NPDC052566]|uniref:lytic murein transglycosylase n=1 Tax=Nocardia sp. NPDC052566 TaxID=3364330 RepID=UPI0037C85197
MAAASALIAVGVMMSGSDVDGTTRMRAAEELSPAAIALDYPPDPKATQTIGLLPVATEQPRTLSALAPTADSVALHDISLPGGGTLGIPELVLAAYRNAELTLQSSTPTCGLTWHLLAGIGKVESDHASNGRTDANGTTVGVIYGPALDGTLPGNEIIAASDGSYVRAVGPMQFLPTTWSQYASDGNVDGTADPSNVFDAALAAGKYLCSGGLDLHDQQQELRAVLRYNNSLDYAKQVLSLSNAYKTGGRPTPVTGSRDPITPGGPGNTKPSRTTPREIQVDTTIVPTPTDPPPAPGTDQSSSPTTPSIPTDPTTPPALPNPATPAEPSDSFTVRIEVVIIIPGRAPIPCGIFCPGSLPGSNRPVPGQPTPPRPTTPTAPPTVTPDPTGTRTPTTTLSTTPPPTSPTPTTTRTPTTTQTPTTTTTPSPTPTTSTRPTTPPPTGRTLPESTVDQETTTSTPPPPTSPRNPTTTTEPNPIQPNPPPPDRPTQQRPSTQEPIVPAPTTRAPAPEPPQTPTATTESARLQPTSRPEPPSPDQPAPKQPDNQQPATPAPPTPATAPPPPRTPTAAPEPTPAQPTPSPQPTTPDRPTPQQPINQDPTPPAPTNPPPLWSADNIGAPTAESPAR